MMLYTEIDAPIGALLVAGDGECVHEIHFAPAKPRADWVRDDNAFAAVKQQLREYFAGDRRAFDVEIAMAGTPFQLQVWSALRAIPYGETRSYAEIAAGIGRPNAVRAVGAANGANPIPIVVPCHRVIGSNGSLTGFGGGLGVKRRLLELERGERRLLD